MTVRVGSVSFAPGLLQTSRQVRIREMVDGGAGV